MTVTQQVYRSPMTFSIPARTDISRADRYLELTVPLAKENVAELTLEDVLVSGTQSVVRYQLAKRPGETVQACDWLTFAEGQLAQVRSYYERPNRPD